MALAGFPPLAGFFLKMAFLDVFITYKRLASIVFILIMSALTMYAYFNAIICILDNNKGGGVLPSSRFTYKARAFFLEKNDSPAVLIYVLLLILIGYVSAAPEAFMVLLDETVMFFYDNGFYILNKEVDSPFCQKEAFLGFIFCKGRNYFNTLKS